MSQEDRAFLGFRLYKPIAGQGLGELAFDSLEYGIYRVSSGDRYTEDLLPQSQDKTMSVKGQNGVYYLGTYFSEKVITLQTAFDKLYEYQLFGYSDSIETIFNDLINYQNESNGFLFELVLDENPWKKYLVTFNDSPQFNFLPFADNENDDETVLKGEATFSFVCTDPFARQTYKYKNQFNANTIEWCDTWEFGLINNSLGDWDTYKLGAINVWNMGDIALQPLIEIDTTGFANSKIVVIHGASYDNNGFKWYEAVQINLRDSISKVYLDNNLESAFDNMGNFLPVIPIENVNLEKVVNYGKFITLKSRNVETPKIGNDQIIINPIGCVVSGATIYYEYQYMW